MTRVSRIDHARVLREQAHDEAERPNVPPRPADPDPTSWGSRCAGNRTGLHMRVSMALRRTAEYEPDHRWRCQSCWKLLQPLPPGEPL